MPHIIPIRDLKDTNNISRLCQESDEPIFVTKNGYGEMVIMSQRVYEEKLHMLDVYDKLEAAASQVKDGKVLDAGDALKRLRAKHGV